MLLKRGRVTFRLVDVSVNPLQASGDSLPPTSEKLHDFKTWAEEGPPKGTLYNYPPKPDQIVSMAAYPAPPKIGAQIYTQAIATKLVAKYTQGGQSMAAAIGWAASELEGFMRA